MKVYESNEKHMTWVAFGVFGLLSLGLFISVFSWLAPNTVKLQSGLLVIWLGLFISTTFHAFSCKRMKFFGDKDSQGEKNA